MPEALRSIKLTATIETNKATYHLQTEHLTELHDFLLEHEANLEGDEMATPKTLYAAADGSGIFLFTSRPVFERSKGDSAAEGIWSESADGQMILQLINSEARNILGFVPDNNTCWDVTLVSTLIERVEA